jgi:predicted metal-dependent peptidase
MSNHPEAVRALTKCKISMMCGINTVFISTILFNLKQSWNTKIQTAQTNGIFLQINPDWFVGLTPDERLGLIAHECWHVAWNHMQRGKHKEDRAKYNLAGDHIINNTLIDAGMKIPSGGVCDTQYRGMSTGEVYNMLPPTPPDDGGSGGQGMSNDVVFSDQSDADDEANNVQVQNTIVKAKVQHDMSGDDPGAIPGELLRRIEEMINPVLPWNIILLNHMNKYAKADYSFKRPNKRFFPEFYMPSAISQRLDNISVMIDLSGSISDDNLQAFLS